MRRPVVMGNWKLNGSKAMVTELLTGLWLTVNPHQHR